MEVPVQATILEQYKLYNDSKERYIDRNFATNRFYTVVCLVILFVVYLAHILTPSPPIVMAVCSLGMFTSSLWWLNVDTYNKLIKIKYGRVLEVLEESLPKQPFREEYQVLISDSDERKGVFFADVQKLFASLVFIVFLLVLAVNAYIFIKYNIKIGA